MAEAQDLTASERHFYTQYVLMDICMTNATSTRILKHATLQEFAKCKMVEESGYIFQVIVNLKQDVFLNCIFPMVSFTMIIFFNNFFFLSSN